MDILHDKKQLNIKLKVPSFLHSVNNNSNGVKMGNSYLEWVAILGEIFSQDIQHPDHLREDQDSVASLSKSGEQLGQQHQLPTAPY